MKKFTLLLLLILLLLSSVLLFNSCNGDSSDAPVPDDEQDGDEPGGDEPDTPLSGLVLVRGGVAQFKVVIASGAGSEGRRAAGELVDTLRSLGVEIADCVEDKRAEDISECEIIVGIGAKNRPDGCAILATDLGNEGYLIRTVGKRIVIAGGTPALTRSTVKQFISEYMGITDTTETLKSLAVDESINLFVPTKYSIESIKIADNDISEYVILCDENDYTVYPDLAEQFRNAIYAAHGVRLNIVSPNSVPTGKKTISLASVADAGEDGFRVRISEENMLVECSVPFFFSDCLKGFTDDAISSKSGSVEFSKDYTYTKHVATVSYADFGAVGDGAVNDFFAIKAAHERVNITGQRLIPKGTKGNVFKIGKTWDDGIKVGGILDCAEDGTPHRAQFVTIKTDMDFGTASFVIDDNVAGISEPTRRLAYVFRVEPDISPIIYMDGTKHPLSTLASSLEIKAGQKNIPWLTQIFKNLPGDKFHVTLENENKRDFIRFGDNQNQGYIRNDVILVDRDGNVDASTPVVFDFKTVTKMTVIPTDDAPITVSGGQFTTICPKCTDSSVYQSTKNDTWARGIRVARANTTVKNIDHKVTAEPAEKGYSCAGFLNIDDTYNVTFSDSKLSARQYYTVGTYDLTVNDALYVTIKGITQYRDIKDRKYWGITVSNGCKRLTYDGCTISRVDAHCGFWNVDIKNCTLGFDLNVIGGGTLNIVNVTRRVGEKFLKLRNDYGATFDGVINIKNCHMNGYMDWNSNDGSFVAKYHTMIYLIRADFTPNATYGSSSYAKWNFGYTCYMPREVNIDKFTYDAVAGRSFYVFSNVADTAFNSNLPNGGYQLTKLITYKNMSKPAICSDATCTKLRSIPVKSG